MTALRRVPGGLHLPAHLRAAGRALSYIVLGIPYGVAYLVLVGGGLVLGVVLSLVCIGLPLLAAVARLAWQLAEGERRQANRLLDAHLPLVPRPPRRALGDWRQTLEESSRAAPYRAVSRTSGAVVASLESSAGAVGDPMGSTSACSSTSPCSRRGSVSIVS